MPFLLSMWHFRESDSFERFTMARHFVSQNLGKVDSGSLSEKNLLPLIKLCLQTDMYALGCFLLAEASKHTRMHCECAVGRFPLALEVSAVGGRRSGAVVSL